MGTFVPRNVSEVVAALRRLRVAHVVLDAELVVLHGAGRRDFDAACDRLRSAGAPRRPRQGQSLDPSSGVETGDGDVMWQEQEPVLGGLTRLSAPGAFHPAVLAQLFVNQGYRERWFGWRPHFKRTRAGIEMFFGDSRSIELAIAPLGIVLGLKAMTGVGQVTEERSVALAIDSSPEETVGIMWEAVDGFLAHLGWPVPR